MIKYYYRSLRTSGMQDLEAPKRGTWVYAEAPSHKELEQLAEKYDLALDLLQDALDEEEVPRLDKENGASYIFVRFAYTRACVAMR